MVNYNNGKIYKIVCNITGLVYVGSTTRKYLSQRLVLHKCNYQRYIQKKSTSYYTSFKILENNDYDIILLESVICDNKDELHKRERYYIETFDCVNKCIPGRTKQERYQIDKDNVLKHQKEYYKNNKERIQESKKIYQQNNKENIKKYMEKYVEDNKEKLQKQSKVYQCKNRGKIRQYKKDVKSFKNSWGGDPRYNNNLLKIDVNLFN
eukprot:SAG11_NODE_10028_length_861_cov_30.934383_2_plen_208_part_00